MSTSLFAPDATQQVRQAIKPAIPVKADLTPPDGPPVPVLVQSYNFFGGIGNFSARVQAVTDAHEQQFGYRPDPTTVLKAAADPTIPDAQLQNLFAPAPTSSMLALVAHPVTTDAAFVKQMRQAAVGDQWDSWLQENGDRVQQLAGEKQWQGQVHGIVLRRNTYDGMIARAQATGATPEEAKLSVAHQQKVNAEGLASFGWIAHPVQQIFDSLVHSPGGAFSYLDTALRAAGELDRATVPGAPSPATPATGKFIETNKAIGKGFAQDFAHPDRNAGNLFLDILGLASLGAGTAARIAAAGRVARAGEGIGAAARTLAEKPPLQRATLNLGGYTEEMPLSSNPLVAAAQKVVLGARQKAADLRLDEGPSPLRSIIAPQAAADFLEQNLSFERKIGREADARQRVEHEAQMRVSHELQAAAGTALTQSRILGRLPVTVKHGLTRGEQKAIQVLSWDDPNPLQAERDFHQRMIDMGVGSAKAHQRQLADLTLAEKALQNPRPRFQQALDLTREVVAEQQQIKIQKLGLAVETAEGRIAKAGAVLRGENLNPPRTIEEARTRLAELEKQHEKAVDKVAAGLFGPAVRSEVRFRTGKNVKAAEAHERAQAATRRRGWGSSSSGAPQVPTVVEERRALAEKAVEAQIAKTPDHPSLRRWIQRTDEIDQLRADLNPMPGEAPTFAGGPLERKTGESFYLPTQPRGKVRRQPSQARGKFSISAGPYGIPAGRDLPELTHEFNGDALRAGDIRIDATNLASEAYGRTVRAATVMDQHTKLWKSASATQRTEWDIPIRDVNTIPDALREAVAKLDEGSFTAADAELLPQDMAHLIQALYPDRRALTEEEIKHVRWTDSRLLGDSLGPAHIPGWGTRIAQAINAPFRFLALYLRPAYILNKLGNAAMLVFDQGFLNSLENMGRAMSIETTDGARNAATIRALVGAGKSRSYVASQSGKISRGVAEFWNRVADRDERVASWTYYADRKGYKTPEQRNELLNDPANQADLLEVTRRANKALVEFDNLTPFEKNTMRHLIFVYPWVRGSAVWSLRAIMEHPAKTALLAQLGKQEIQNDPILDHAPSWFTRTGYFPVGWNSDGTPRVVNPTSINSFTTIGDFLNIGKGATVGDKYASVSNLLGPAAQFGIHASTGRDEFGNTYPGSQFLGAARDVLIGLPQLTKLRGKKNKPLSSFDIRNRASLEASLNSALHQTVFTPGWLDGFGSLIAGGLSEKGLNPGALAARYWNDQDPKVRTARELNLLNRALTMQGQFLGKGVPGDVRRSVSDHAKLTLSYAQFAKDTGRGPTDKERVGLIIDYLAGAARITDSQASRLRGQLKPLIDAQQLSAFERSLGDKYLAAKDLRKWDTNVRLLYSFHKDTFNEKAGRLFAQGLSPQRVYNVPQDKLFEYGRKYVAFTEKVKDMRAQIKVKTATAADLRLLADENSKPVDGLPSFAAIAWANQTPAEQQHALIRDAAGSWGTRTAVDKELLGKPVKDGVQLAWAAYQHVTSPAEVAKQLPPGNHSFDRLDAAKQIDRAYNLHGAFTNDFLFAQRPLWQRLPYLTIFRDSPNKVEWNALIANAKTTAQAVANKTVTGATARDEWNQYAAELPAAMKANFPGFWRELQPILAADPTFLRTLYGPERTPANG